MFKIIQVKRDVLFIENDKKNKKKRGIIPGKLQ